MLGSQKRIGEVLVEVGSGRPRQGRVGAGRAAACPRGTAEAAGSGIGGQHPGAGGEARQSGQHGGGTGHDPIPPERIGDPARRSGADTGGGGGGDAHRGAQGQHDEHPDAPHRHDIQQISTPGPRPVGGVGEGSRAPDRGGGDGAGQNGDRTAQRSPDPPDPELHRPRDRTPGGKNGGGEACARGPFISPPNTPGPMSSSGSGTTAPAWTARRSAPRLWKGR